MAIVEYKRPTGTSIKVNDTPETRALAETLGWKKAARKRTTNKKAK